MSEIKVSVIVPVYKAEDYLHRCVCSLLTQTFDDFEIVLVDDGSPDRCGKLCDEYARIDKRVRVFHQTNAGVSMARQKGLDEARGEYVIHADPDDWVEPDMLKQLYSHAKEEDADMVICDYFINHGEKMVYRCQKPSSLDHETVLCELFQQLHGSCCNKLVRRACYNKYQIKFPVGVSFCEDQLTNAMLLTHDIKVSYLAKAFYHYEQTVNPNSFVHTYSYKRFEEDERLAFTLAEVVRGTKAERLAINEAFSRLLLCPFIFHTFTTKEYIEKCKPYRKYIFARGIEMGIFFELSFCGLYHPMYYLWKTKDTVCLYIKTVARRLLGK